MEWSIIIREVPKNVYFFTKTNVKTIIVILNKI